MVSGMIEGVLKQMVDKFPGTSADNLVASMGKQPQAGQLFRMMKSVGITEDKLKKMINDEIISRQKL